MSPKLGAMKEKFLTHGPTVLQLLSAVIVGLAAVRNESPWNYVFMLVALGNVAAGAFLLGRRHVFRSLERSVEHLPKNVHINEDDAGKKVAIVELLSGDLVTIELPEEIDNPQDAMQHIMDELTPQDD